MEKEFIPYEQELELKDLGYVPEPIVDSWHSLTLYQQAFRWFREKYDLFGVVEGKGYDHKRYYVYSINGKWHPSQPGLDTYEEAELACLQKLIEIVKL